MHGRGIVHRDIKTENILIDGDGYCLLADMGLAAVCALEDREQKGHTSLWPSAPIGKRENHLINPKDGVVVRRNRTSFMGTPEYMCPEMILKKTRAQPNPPPPVLQPRLRLVGVWYPLVRCCSSHGARAAA